MRQARPRIRSIRSRDNDPYRYAEATLKQAGILYSVHGPHRVTVVDDVLYSLRYLNDAHCETS